MVKENKLGFWRKRKDELLLGRKNKYLLFFICIGVIYSYINVVNNVVK